MKRYAVYFAPRPGPFAERAAAWLGWDAERGTETAHPILPGLPVPAERITGDPRKYGFHGTLRAPFRPAEGVAPAQIETAVARLAAGLAPVRCDGLRLEDLDGFLALVPTGCGPAVERLAAAVVEGTDSLRAPLGPEEVARRRPDTLTARQRELLDRWGYPYVMEEFQFHLTLTSRLDATMAAPVAGVLRTHFEPVLPTPFVVEDLCLFGEDNAGRFHLLHRYPLAS